MKSITIAPLPSTISHAPYCTGGALCSAGSICGYVAADGSVHLAPDDGSTWSNTAHDGPRPNMRAGRPLAVPADALATFDGWYDDINGGRVSVSITAPSVRAALMAAPIVARATDCSSNCHWSEWKTTEHNREVVRRMRNIQYIRDCRAANEAAEKELCRKAELEEARNRRSAHLRSMKAYQADRAVSGLADALVAAGF